MRKLLSVILVLAMVLGLVGTALAAVPTDVAGTTSESAVMRLQALGILKGYTDGTFKPANNITRAEFAAVAVRALGLEETAKMTVGQTKFTDVTGTHWAAGYINVAVGNGIIKGYPDGTFKPEANVTNAEAMAMLVRVLGYEPSVTGEWPMNYVSKAAELGLTSGLVLPPNTLATRGNVAMMTSNSLTVELMAQSSWGTLSSYAPVPGTSLLVTKLGVEEIKGDVVDLTPLYGRTELKANQVDLHTNGIYTFDASINMDALLLHKVDAWAKDGNIFYVADKTSSTKVVTPSKVVHTFDGAIPGKVTFGATDTTKYTLNSPTIFYNWDLYQAGNEDTDLVGCNVTLILDSDNEVTGVIATKFDDPVIVTKVTNTADVQVIKNADNGGTNADIDVEVGNTYDAVTIVDATGAVKTLADVAKNDVIAMARNIDTDQAYIRITRNVVTGEVTKVTETDDSDLTTFKVYVGNNSYGLSNNAVTSTDLAFTRVDSVYDPIALAADANALVGSTGTFYLDASGKILAADLTEAAEAINYAFVMTAAWDVNTTSGVTGYVKLMKMDGTKVTMALDGEAGDFAALAAAGTLVTYEVSDNLVTDATAVVVAGSAVTINTTYDRITLGGDVYVVNADTKVFDLDTNAAIPAASTWAAVEAVAADGTLRLCVIANADYPNRAELVLVTALGGAFGSSDVDNSVMVKSFYSVNTSSGVVKHMYVDENGTEKDYIVTGSTAGITPGMLVDLTVNSSGKVTAIAGVTYESEDYTIASGDLDMDAGVLTDSSVPGTYFFTSKTIVYDFSDGETVTKVTTSAIAAGDVVSYVVDANDNITYLVITDR